MTDSEVELSQGLAAHREPIFRYIRGIVRDSAAAEDLTQETLLRAHRKQATLEDPAKLGTWLYRIATNTCLQMLRKRRGKPVEFSEKIHSMQGTTSPSPERTIAARRLLERVLDRLDQRGLEILEAHHLDGMNQSEIAEHLGISRRAVVKRLTKIRNQFGRLFEESNPDG